MGKRSYQSLTTPFEASNGPTWAETHPRPQLYRKDWQTLCGPWQLWIRRAGGDTPIGTIQVPFPPESRISGVRRELKEGEKLVYRREFELHELVMDRLLLHFGAVDQIARVWVNGTLAGTHTGGYLPFTLDITDLVSMGENTLTVEATDELDENIPFGKQSRKRGGMWYTPVSGIWQPVWLEWVPENYIRSLTVTPALDSVTITSKGGGRAKRLLVQTPNGTRELHYSGDTVTFQVTDPHLWTPEDPYLYPFVLTDGTDAVTSYFALRTITIEEKNGMARVCLNGRPIFLHGLLDQGYFSDGIYLPAKPEGYEFDVRTAKALGFNLLRKHIKVESDLFYAQCDRQGMLVLQDMVNSGKYHYLRDTALPTVLRSSRKGYTHTATPERAAQFESDARGTVEALYNHPSVIGYTIFNEGWGQYDADRIYDEMKELDPTRLWNATSGWFAQSRSDFDSEHIYFRKVDLTARRSRPLLLSEFGGWSCKLPKHSFNLDKTYGYKKYDSLAHFRHDLITELYRGEIIPSIRKGLSGAVLTQLTDVEDETNGLVTYDRQVVKCEPEPMQALAKELFAVFREQAE